MENNRDLEQKDIQSRKRNVKTLQKWLDNRYPTKEDKEKVKEINIKKINQERENQGTIEKLFGETLDLAAYPNLEIVWIRGEWLKTPLTNLNVNNCEQLIWLDLRNNQLTNINLTNCANLEKLQCVGNLLVGLDLTNNHQLKELWLSNNNFSEQDLTFVSHLTDLKGLSLGSYDQVRIQQDIYNRFHGSLEPLKSLTKLERLYIRSADVNDGLEYSPDSLRDFYCSAKERPGAKIKILEQELRKFGEPNNYNFANLLKAWKARKKEFTSSPAQQWLDKWYPEEGECQRGTADEGWDGSYGWYNEYKKREQITQLDINNQDLEGGLRLKGFTNLEKLNCSENQLTNLDLSDCPKLTGLKCDQNALNNLALFQTIDKLRVLLVQNNPNLSQDLKIFTSFRELTHLDISNCPFGGSLRPLENLNKLEIINISNTNLREGLEFLPDSCKKVYCNSNYPYQSTKIMEELDKSKCLVEEENNRHYEIDKWRVDRANNVSASIIPLERLFVIRSNLKQFLKRWDKEYEGAWYEEPFSKLKSKENKPTELSKLKNPNEINSYWYIGESGQWAARGVAVTGGVLAATTNPVLGGVLAASSPVVEVFASQMKERLYEAKQAKWDQFIDDADMFLDNYHELLGILKKIKVGELGAINQELKNLQEQVNHFLEDYDEDGNGEIDMEELTNKRDKLSQELKHLRAIVVAMEKVEDKVINYQQNGLVEIKEESAETGENSQSQPNKLINEETISKENLNFLSRTITQIKGFVQECETKQKCPPCLFWEKYQSKKAETKPVELEKTIVEEQLEKEGNPQEAKSEYQAQIIQAQPFPSSSKGNN
ncbi:hypothetical protein [endosymbiont GvMRE of Glomus versiforme]|uniref:hypothetical protein n=1 Tax=endosymbiont GvMRE of Glomus versiforme TaxID=2039283 RepID=UPI000ECADD6D|nr:hypothetical protein [endosymbiont GvMRE of Glomus versiforme]RHZ36164.1 HET domain protein [endosymbiont GvMRE of Glomus versiforme]